MTASKKPATTAHLFNVDLLVESDSDALALERLIQRLNSAGFADYRIKSGIRLGRKIEALEEQGIAEPVPVEAQPAVSPQAEAPPEPAIIARIKTCIATNSLIRLMVNKGFGVRLNIPCRIIHLNETEQKLTVYHVDEKQVYSFTLNEIDDFN